jgi:antitoxin component of MazEF toxin-antitoxin module
MQVSVDGTIAIPPDIQQQLGLTPGTEVELEIVGSTLNLKPKIAVPADVRTLKQCFGFLPKRIDPLHWQTQVRSEWQR